MPQLITLSSAEAETNATCVATMAVAHIRQIVMEIETGNADAPYTVPLLLDSSAADAIMRNDKDTRRTRHIARRWLYTRSARRQGELSVHHVNGDKFQVADPGTKNLPMNKASYKLSIVEAEPIP